MFDVIVSVHVPKAAGSSFLQQLRNLYGEEHVKVDCDDDPVNPLSVVNMDPYAYEDRAVTSIHPCKAVHGHFHPGKYAGLTNAFRATFLRHPVDNILSIYYFWSAHDRETWDSPIFRYVKDEGFSVRRFALIPAVRYLYSRSYFGGFPMSAFDFIGDYADYDNELQRLGAMLGVEFAHGVRKNITTDCFGPGSPLARMRSEAVRADYDELARILEDDIAFYERYKGR